MINRAIVLAKDNILKPEYFPNEIFHTMKNNSLF